MNFKFYLVSFFRILLFPFSLIYGLIVIVRNYLFNKNILKSVSFNLPVIGIGNLSVGGTGKSPMVEYLVELLQQQYHLAIVSRGYKRKTKGYVLANAKTTALEIGDEPMQFHRKFPNVAVAVGEERVLAIPQLLRDKPETNVIILDDSFQHRKIKPGFNILLTSYDSLFTTDFFLPTGNLRDQRSSAKRADVIVVTKCPADISEQEMSEIQKQIQPSVNQHLFFTAIQYGQPYHIITKEARAVTKNEDVLLVCGIAKPMPLKNYLAQSANTCFVQSYADHHLYDSEDIKEIKEKFHAIQSKSKLIITTEKDAARLTCFEDEVMKLPLYVLPVQHQFLWNEGSRFDGVVKKFIETFERYKK